MSGRWLVHICWLLVILCLDCSAAWAAEPLPQEIRMVSEHWTGHTNTDGSGLAWELMRKVFEPAGVCVAARTVPYTRSVGLVQRGDADAWLGSYRNEITEHVVYPHTPYDADRVVALSLGNTPSPTLRDIGRYRLAWMRGYGYQDYLPDVHHYDEIQRRVGILRMLELRRADFYLDASSEVEEVLHEGPDPALFRITPLIRLPLYVGFADTPRGHALARLFDQRMAELLRSGGLRPLFKHWRQPYPFDKDMEIPDASP